MNEKHEKWVIFALVALALWWLFSKYGKSTSAGQTAVVSNIIGGVPGDSSTTYYPAEKSPGDIQPVSPIGGLYQDTYSIWNKGSVVNPIAEHTVPVTITQKPFAPAQPAMPTKPVSNIRLAGSFTGGQSIALLRY